MLANAQLLQQIADFYRGAGQSSTVHTAAHFRLTVEQTRALLKLAGVKLRRGRRKLDDVEVCVRQIAKMHARYGSRVMALACEAYVKEDKRWTAAA